MTNDIERSALLLNESRFRLALSGSPIVVFEQDLDLRYTWIFNPKLGYAANEIIGKTDDEIMEARAASLIGDLKRSVIESGKPLQREVSTSAPNGPISYYDLNIEPRYDEAGAIIGIICAATDISERKLSEQSLKQSKALYRRMLDAVPASIAVLDCHGTIVWTNEQWRHFANKNGADHKGVGIGTNYFEACRADTDIAQGDGMHAASGIRAVIENSAPMFRLEYPCHSPTKPRWFEMTAVPLGSKDQAVMVIHTDITSRKMHEMSIEASRDQLMAFIQYAPVSIAMFDKEMNYLAVSKRWTEDFGRGYNELIGRNHYNVNPDLPKEWMDVHQRSLAGASFRNDDDMWIHADGSNHWLRWAVQPWTDIAGAVSGIIIATEDVTKQKKAELEESQANQAKKAFWERLINLTRREREVLSAALGGMGNKAIASHLAASIRTVEGHRARIYLKLRIGSVIELVKDAATVELTLAEVIAHLNA